MAVKDPDLECGTETIHDDTAYHETADPMDDCAGDDLRRLLDLLVVTAPDDHTHE